MIYISVVIDFTNIRTQVRSQNTHYNKQNSRHIKTLIINCKNLQKHKITRKPLQSA